MSRHINWALIFFLGLLIVLAGSIDLWLGWLEPLRGDTAVQESGFPCPPEFASEVCSLLEGINQEDPLEAEAMMNALQSEPIPAPANEASLDSIEESVDRDTVSVFSLTRVRTGNFTEIDPIHQGEGTANIWELVADEDVQRYLRFEEDFRVSRGPDLRVYLSINAEPRTGEEMLASDSAVEIGFLKGNLGGQNYLLNDDIDVTQYRSVVIFSAQFGRVFTSARLQQPIQ